MDAQGDSTQNLNVDCDNLEYTVYDVLVNDLPISNAIIHTAFNIDLVGANKNLDSI